MDGGRESSCSVVTAVPSCSSVVTALPSGRSVVTALRLGGLGSLRQLIECPLHCARTPTQKERGTE